VTALGDARWNLTDTARLHDDEYQLIQPEAPVAKKFAYVNMMADGESVLVDENGQVSSLGVIALGALKRFSGPAYVVGKQNKANGIAEWSNLALAGQRFVNRPFRFPPNDYFIYAVEACTVTVTKNGNSDREFTLAAGKFHHFGGNYVDQVMRFSSTGDILLSVMSSRPANGAGDILPIPPAAETLYGTCSALRCWIDVFGADESVKIQESCTDGSSKSVTPGEGFTGADQYTGKSCKWVAPSGILIGGYSYGDGDGGDGTTFIPSTFFQRITVVPVNMEFLLMVSDSQATCTSGSSPFTLQGSATHQVFSKRLGSTEAGTLITCNAKVTALGDARWAIAGQDSQLHDDEYQLIQPEVCSRGG